MLSFAVGTGMLLFLPIASLSGDVSMVVTQGAVTTAAVLLCILLAAPLGLRAPAPVKNPVAFAPMLREVWVFTLIQLAGLVGMNAAGWWLTSLVARADSSLIQMGFYAIANQLRNMVGLLPGLLSQSSLAIMSESEGDAERTPDRVLAVCSFVSTIVSFALAGVGILIAPSALGLIYGRSFEAASAATILSLATAVVHMGNAPAAGRLAIVSIKSTGVINTIWAILVAAFATLFLFNGGSAAAGAALILAAHILSSTLVLAVLKWKASVPPGLVGLYALSTMGTLALSSVALARDWMPAWGSFVLLSVIFLGCLGLLAAMARKHRWMPNGAVTLRLLSVVREFLAVRSGRGVCE